MHEYMTYPLMEVHAYIIFKNEFTYKTTSTINSVHWMRDVPCIITRSGDSTNSMCSAENKYRNDDRWDYWERRWDCTKK